LRIIVALIWVLNCGSSSVKFALINPQSGAEALSGLAENIGSDQVKLTQQTHEKQITEALGPVGYASVLDTIAQHLQNYPEFVRDISAVGHRVVHGGEAFKESVIVNEDVIKQIEDCNELAPLHNPWNLLGIECATAAFPHLPQVAVFDTAFHQSLPNYAFLYPLPYDLYQRYHLRKYGFHGISHRYVTQQATQLLGKSPNQGAFLSAHLGNGCSIAAVKDGKSIDTSMGLTPLAGLMMGTRSGDIDPGIHAFLAEHLHLDVEGVTRLLNTQSGLLGVSGFSMDMRQLHTAAASGDQRATLAITMFCYHLAKQLAAMAVPLGHIDALIFTGGIGENDREVRVRVLNALEFLGFSVDDTANQSHGQHNQRRITQVNSIPALVIPTNEALLIAQDSLNLTQPSGS
jgi:acetate kinase